MGPRNIALWLDEVRPDWWQRIDADRLDMGSKDRCIVGQLYGHWSSSKFLGYRRDENDDHLHVAVTGGCIGFFAPAPFWLDEIDARKDRHRIMVASGSVARLGAALDELERRRRTLFVPSDWTADRELLPV